LTVAADTPRAGGGRKGLRACRRGLGYNALDRTGSPPTTMTPEAVL
jgi:hypothetical protein